MKVQRKETIIVTTDIELKDPLQNFGDRQPRTSYLFIGEMNTQYIEYLLVSFS